MYKLKKKQKLFDFDNPIVTYNYKIVRVKKPINNKETILKFLASLFWGLILLLIMYFFTVFALIVF